jgi:hypothetical protein
MVGMPSAAAAPLVFPAGVACPSFGISVDAAGGNQQVHNLRNGRVVTGGTGSSLTFTNLSTGRSLTLPSNGSTSKVTPNPGGTTTNAIQGHTILILFPTDKPAGPSTTLVIGRAVFTSDAAGNFNVQSIVGRSVDICAALS